jgi:hypothetical protein
MGKAQGSGAWGRRSNLQCRPAVREFPSLIRLRSSKRNADSSPETVLIINCCMIGDFVASLPAISDFIRENPRTRIDLLTSPTVAALARRVRGIRRAYATRSVFGRQSELSASDTKLAPFYDLVIVLRLSEPSRRLLAKQFPILAFVATYSDSRDIH